MAEYKFTAALNSSEIPLVSRFQSRPVVITGMDNLLRQANSGVRDVENDNNLQNLPQIVFAENVMPGADRGVKSVGYAALQAQVGGETNFDEVFLLRNETEDVWYYSPARGLNYVTDAWGVAWASTDPQAGAPIGNEVSIAYVNGITYVCYANLWIGHWDGTNFVDDTASLAGVAIADVKAICGSGNYLCLLLEDLSFCWSSLVDPLDFVPDATTGAGSQIPLDVRGEGVCLTSVSGGVIIHCAQNAVAAIYTNNAQSPWVFKEIKNGGGISTRKQVSTDNASGAVYIWGTNGFQRLSLRDSENLFPEVTDFLDGKLIETYNGITRVLSITKDVTFYVKVAYIAGRFIIVSYGTSATEYNYALIYDINLKRWGKIKSDHVDCFSQFTTGRQSICLLRNNGVVNQVVIDDRTQSDGAVVIIGRYQLNRTNQICTQEVEAETLDSGESLSCVAVANFNGTTQGQQLVMTVAEATDNYRKWQGQIEGENVSFIISGTFTLATLLLTFTRGARF